MCDMPASQNRVLGISESTRQASWAQAHAAPLPRIPSQSSKRWSASSRPPFPKPFAERDAIEAPAGGAARAADPPHGPGAPEAAQEHSVSFPTHRARAQEQRASSRTASTSYRSSPSRTSLLLVSSVASSAARRSTSRRFSPTLALRIARRTRWRLDPSTAVSRSPID